MYIESLVIEVTRFCNMNCPHCLRGERQRKRFNTNMIENIFADIDYIGTITFTGGEPLTQVNIIIETLDYIEQNNIQLGAFYIVSNGTIYSKKLMDALQHFYCHYVDEQYMCGFEISQDQYHNEFDDKRTNNIYKYQVLKEYFGYEFINLENRKSIYTVILEGRAKKFSKGRESSYNNGFYSESSEYYNDNQIYVAANGNVISDCDLSFENVDKYSFGNVCNETLKSIIERNTKSEIQAIILK